MVPSHTVNCKRFIFFSLRPAHPPSPGPPEALPAGYGALPPSSGVLPAGSEARYNLARFGSALTGHTAEVVTSA